MSVCIDRTVLVLMYVTNFSAYVVLFSIFSFRVYFYRGILCVVVNFIYGMYVGVMYALCYYTSVLRIIYIMKKNI